MSSEGALTVEDFMILFGNILNQNFSELRGMLVTQSIKLQKLEKMVKAQQKENVDVSKLEESSGITTTPEAFIVPEEQFAKELKQDYMQVPSTSTPKPKRNRADDDLDNNEEGAQSPYEIYCFDCKKSFIRGSGEFTRHIKETTCKPYKCHCGKLFKKKSSLTTHMSTHSTETFTCHCGAIFKCEQYLKNHKIRRKHFEEDSSAQVNPQPAKRPCISPSAVVKHELNIDEETSIVQESLPFDPMELLKMQMSEVQA